MRKLLVASLASIAMLAGTAQAQGDIAAGKAKSAVCAACHGANGIGLAPIYPNLAGQKEQYLVKQTKAFRDGARQDLMMSPQAAGLSDADIANLAAYYSSLKP